MKYVSKENVYFFFIQYLSKKHEMKNGLHTKKSQTQQL